MCCVEGGGVGREDPPVLPAAPLHLSSPSVHSQSFAAASNICWEQFVSCSTLEAEFLPPARIQTHTQAASEQNAPI